MTGETINLRRARKRRAREQADEAARRNRDAHGRSKAEKRRAVAEKARAAARLEDHLRERGRPDEA